MSKPFQLYFGIILAIFFALIIGAAIQARDTSLSDNEEIIIPSPELIVSFPDKDEVQPGNKVIVSAIKNGIIHLEIAADKHYCNWDKCHHNGEVMQQENFVSIDNVEDTDAFYIELTHFMNPSWSEEKCRHYVFTGVQ